MNLKHSDYMGLKTHLSNHTKHARGEKEHQETLHDMNHKNWMISMEILVTAFKSPFVMSLIVQSNNHSLRSERVVADY